MVLSFDGSPASIGMNMSTGCEFPTIQTFERAPSAADFESGGELTNFPAVLFSPQYTFLFLPPPAESESLDLNLLKVFRGCASDWEACSKWNPFSNGLDYLILKEDDIVGLLETEDIKDLKPLNDRVFIKVFPLVLISVISFACARKNSDNQRKSLF